MTKKNLILVFLILIIISGLGFGGFLLLQNKKNQDQIKFVNIPIENSKLTEVKKVDDIKIVKAKVPPTITTNPYDRVINPGNKATFSVVATGDNLNYQWKKDGVNIAGATSTSYTTDPALLKDNGSEIVVVVNNSQGSVTSFPVHLDVVLPIVPVGTTPSTLSASSVIDSKGGSVTLTGVGSLTVPPSTLSNSQTVTLSIDPDPSQIIDALNVFALNWRSAFRTNYIVKCNIGKALPNDDGVSISLTIPEELKAAASNGNEIIVSMYHPADGDDTEEGIESITANIDLVGGIAKFNVPEIDFYNYLAPAKTYHVIFFLTVFPK